MPRRNEGHGIQYLWDMLNMGLFLLSDNKKVNWLSLHRFIILPEQQCSDLNAFSRFGVFELGISEGRMSDNPRFTVVIVSLEYEDIFRLLLKLVVPSMVGIGSEAQCLSSLVEIPIGTNQTVSDGHSPSVCNSEWVLAYGLDRSPGLNMSEKEGK
jgi:hypothetical protein